MNEHEAVLCSTRQAGAGGALRCAIFAIEDACRQLDWHYHELDPKLADDEYLKKLEKLTTARLAAIDALRPLWKLCGGSTPIASCGGYGICRTTQNMETEQLATKLCNSTETHEEWLSVMRFGMNTLLGDPLVLIDCIFTEAKREKERNDKPRNQQEVPAIAWEIFEELELKITNGEDA